MERQKKKKIKLLPYALILPGMVLLLVLKFAPAIQNILYSFTNYKLKIQNYSYIGLENYVKVLTEGEFAGALGKTIAYTLIVLAYCAVFGILSAFVLNSQTLKGKFIFRIFLLIPWVLPEVLTGYIWKLLLEYQSGPYWKLLNLLHLLPGNGDIFSDGVAALIACATANGWRGFVVVAITVYAKLQTMLPEQVEAAVLDGATRFQLFRYIEFPHISVALSTILTLCFIWTFNAFGIISVMTNGGPVGATETLPVFLQRKGFIMYEYGEAAAFAILMMFVVLILVGLSRLVPALISKKTGE